jgi:predicted transcriptional regulator
MFSFFSNKRENDRLRQEIQESFNHVKKDFGKVGEWIKHIDDKNGSHDADLVHLKEQVLAIQKDLIEIKDFISFFGPHAGQSLSKQAQQGGGKQTNNLVVQTPVQTPVQTEILEHLSVMERGIVWALLNSDMHLSYEDLAALLGKDKSTIRGQINSIRQKSSGLVEEIKESNGKKRLYIPEKVRLEIVKSVKLRVNRTKKHQSEKSES